LIPTRGAGDMGKGLAMQTAASGRLTFSFLVLGVVSFTCFGQRPSTRPATRAAEDPDFLKREQNLPLAPRPAISDLEHVVLHYDKSTYCGHPRMVAFQYFGGGEIVVGHFHAPSKYEVYDDVRHVSYQGRSVCLLQRSTDGGKSWPKENDVVIYEKNMSEQRRQAFLNQPNAPREQIDMFRPESMFFFQYTSELKEPCTSFCIRSGDKGRTWEKVPTIIPHPFAPGASLHRHNTPVIRMPDGRTLLAGFQMADPARYGKDKTDAAVFSSTDNGLSWQLLSVPVRDRSGGEGQFVYITLLLLPGGELQCYTLHLDKSDETVAGMKNAICLTSSKDGGKTWGPTVPIVGKGGSCWKNAHGTGVIYRSPWPVLLKDGRILCLFARRRMPAGIGGVVSRDGGRTWSEEFVLRDDGQWWDLGYPVGCQLDDGRIFTAYYFNKQDGNLQGGTRYIAASSFTLNP
jgi:hypothetical protein